MRNLGAGIEHTFSGNWQLYGSFTTDFSTVTDKSDQNHSLSAWDVWHLTGGAAVYSRAEDMYAALHDLLGDATFRAVLRDYYARWAFRHVDRWALQGSAERVSERMLKRSA